MLTFADVRREFPIALQSDQRTWLISVPAEIAAGITWDKVLAKIFDYYQKPGQAICFEQLGERDGRAIVLVNVWRKAKESA